MQHPRPAIFVATAALLLTAIASRGQSPSTAADAAPPADVAPQDAAAPATTAPASSSVSLPSYGVAFAMPDGWIRAVSSSPAAVISLAGLTDGVATRAAEVILAPRAQDLQADFARRAADNRLVPHPDGSPLTFVRPAGENAGELALTGMKVIERPQSPHVYVITVYSSGDATADLETISRGLRFVPIAAPSTALRPTGRPTPLDNQSLVFELPDPFRANPDPARPNATRFSAVSLETMSSECHMSFVAVDRPEATLAQFTDMLTGATRQQTGADITWKLTRGNGFEAAISSIVVPQGPEGQRPPPMRFMVVRSDQGRFTIGDCSPLAAGAADVYFKAFEQMAGSIRQSPEYYEGVNTP